MITQKETLEFNARKSPDLVNPMTGDYLEIDIWLPSLRLGFEFQVIYLSHVLSEFITLKERHHYEGVEGFQPLDVIKKRDQIKDELAASRGITLISVPYWWDGQEERFFPPLFQKKNS